MFPAEFDYHRATSVEDAVNLLVEHGDAETELLAGGHSLLPTMKSGLSSPEHVIDIGHIDGLQGVYVTDDSITIGAGTTYATAVDADGMWDRATAFTEAIGAVGDRQVRNRGTVGGNIAHADPASDLPGALLAAGGTVVVQGPDGERSIDGDDFFLGMYATDIASDELLTRVEIPSMGENDVGAYAKKPSPSSGYALVGVAARLEIADGTVESASVGANGAMDRGVRLDPVESALEGEPIEVDTLDEAAERATDDLDGGMMMEDAQASSEFRAQLLEVYTKRALRSCLERTQSPPAAD